MELPVYSNLLYTALTTYASKECFHIKREGTYQSWTYDNVAKDINQICDVLVSIEKLKPSDKVILIGPNTPEWVLVYHAVIQARCQIVPLDPNLSADEIANICLVTSPKLAFCSNEYINTFQRIQRNSSHLQSIISFSENEKVDTYDSFLKQGSPDVNAFAHTFKPEDEVAILFTSGTTGNPKGVVLQQKNLYPIGTAISSLLRIAPGSDERILAVLPLYHVFGFAACIVATITNGLQAVFVPELKGNLILEALNDKEVTILPAIPQLLTIFYKNIQAKVKNSGIVGRSLFKVLGGLSALLGPIGGAPIRAKIYSKVHKGFGGKLRIIVSGGASLDKETFYGFSKMGFTVLEGYGLTETFGPISLCPIDNPKQGTVGPVISRNEVKIDAPSGKSGEILLQGDCVFPGYFNNPQATVEVIDENGWFHTGDIGYLDKEDYIVISGRKKELIVLESGKNLFPDELEEQYLKLPYIEELSIFGLKEGNAEKAVALIVPTVDLRSKYDTTDITHLFQEKFQELHKGKSSYKMFSDFAISKHPLPRTSTRKAIKRECLEIYKAIKSNTPLENHQVKLTVKEENMMATKLFKTIASEVQSQTDAKVILTPKTTFGVDVPMDSLTFTALITSLEQKLKYSLPQESLAQCDTLGDLYIAIEHSGSQSNKTYTESSTPVFKRTVWGTFLNFNLSLFARAISTLFWSLKIKGKKKLSADMPTIFVANHQSNLDAGWVLSQLPGKIRRKTFTLGKYELVKVPIAATVFKAFNILPIDRYGQFNAAIEKAEELLTKGNSILLFPEGTRSLDGVLKEFKTGVGHIASKTKAQIIPIKIKGSFKIWPKGESSPKLFTGSKIKSQLIFGEPIPISFFKDKSPEEITEEVRSIIEKM